MPIDPGAWTDAHCHLQDEAFASDTDQILERADVFGIRNLLVNGTGPDDWPRVAELATSRPGVLPQFGLHPWRAGKPSSDWENRLKTLLFRFPHAGVGEIGLDAKLTDTPMEAQRHAFRIQWDLARHLNRPCTVHLLGAWAELHEELKREPPPRFLLHAFNGSPEQVASLAKYPAWFSFGGAAMRQTNSTKLRDAIRAVPDDRLLLETDAPFQHPDGKDHRQEPAGLLKIAETVATVRGIPVDALRRLTAENFARYLEKGSR